MINAVIITNIPSPYSLDLFNSIQNDSKEIELSVVYSAMSRKNRTWTIETSKMKNTYSLNSIIISKKEGEYTRYIHIPKGTWKTLKKIDADILLVYEYSITSLISLFWAKIYKKKFIHVTEGTLWSEHSIGRVQKILRKIIISNSDFYIACSSKSKEKLMAWCVAENKIRTILLTSNIERYLLGCKKQKNSITKHLLYVGCIEFGKGIDLMIKALKYAGDNVELSLVGSGNKEYIDAMKKLAKEEEVFNKIKFSGFLEGDKLVEKYHQSDLFVFPTRLDCYGLVLVEAYCSRLPIVSSKYADGVYDVVEDGINGLIVDPYNAVEFGNAIKEVLTDEKYSLNALKMDTNKFELKREAEEFEKVIYEIAKAEGSI